ncbi:GNAT family N-acetyltransferase, partial [Arthrobacter sp. CAN_A212]|uniref:GNAT family N-acetyltransferase n=1 Tax=Arthrobacter sp. CAN_A212 TaxID=2787719 RepID=UPI002FF24D5E
MGYHVDEAQMRDRLGRLIDDSTYAAWLLEDHDGRALGLAEGHLVHPLEDSLPAAQLIMLVTSSTSRGKGIGKRLVCQGPVKAAHGRPALLPAGGHENCPVMAIGSAHRVFGGV